jgi:hypothetical protein
MAKRFGIHFSRADSRVDSHLRPHRDLNHGIKKCLIFDHVFHGVDFYP